MDVRDQIDLLKLHVDAAHAVASEAAAHHGDSAAKRDRIKRPSVNVECTDSGWSEFLSD